MSARDPAALDRGVIEVGLIAAQALELAQSNAKRIEELELVMKVAMALAQPPAPQPRAAARRARIARSGLDVVR